jgi:hypothetical protein
MAVVVMAQESLSLSPKRLIQHVTFRGLKVNFLKSPLKAQAMRPYGPQGRIRRRRARRDRPETAASVNRSWAFLRSIAFALARLLDMSATPAILLLYRQNMLNFIFDKGSKAKIGTRVNAVLGM